MNDLQSVVQSAWEQVIAQREEILRAFVAKYGMQPDEIEQVQQRTATGWRWFVQPRRLTTGSTLTAAPGRSGVTEDDLAQPQVNPDR